MCSSHYTIETNSINFQCPRKVFNSNARKRHVTKKIGKTNNKLKKKLKILQKLKVLRVKKCMRAPQTHTDTHRAHKTISKNRYNNQCS